jgi:hypothetical protein
VLHVPEDSSASGMCLTLAEERAHDVRVCRAQVRVQLQLCWLTLCVLVYLFAAADATGG